MILRIERTEKDDILGYEWIEVVDFTGMRYRIDKNGIPRIDITCKVKNNRTTDGDGFYSQYHGSMSWEDIEHVIETGKYKLVKKPNWPQSSF